MAAIGSMPFERGDETEGSLIVTAACPGTRSRPGVDETGRVW